MYTFTRVHEYSCARRPEVTIRCLPPLLFHHVFWDRVSQLELISSARLTVVWLTSSRYWHLAAFPEHWCSRRTPPCLAFMWVQAIWTQDLMFVQQTLSSFHSRFLTPVNAWSNHKTSLGIVQVLKFNKWNLCDDYNFNFHETFPYLVKISYTSRLKVLIWNQMLGYAFNTTTIRLISQDNLVSPISL